MTITLTLTSGSSGTAAGPFTVSGTTDGGSLNGINMTTGSISTAQLTNGWSYNDATDTITGGTINSSGTCVTGKTWTVIAATPTPTNTPTPTPTVVSYSYQLGPSKTFGNTTEACNGINGSGGAPEDLKTEVFAATDQPGDVVQFFTDAGLTSGYAGESETHAYYRTGGFVNYTGTISLSGFVTDRNACP